MKLMKHVLAGFAIASVLGFSINASAKCYHFRDAPSDVYVCVGKGSDSFDDRKAAKKICDEKTGKDCGSVGSSSSSCHSNSNKCYDENGKAHRNLKDY